MSSALYKHNIKSEIISPERALLIGRFNAKKAQFQRECGLPRKIEDASFPSDKDDGRIPMGCGESKHYLIVGQETISYI